MFIAEIGLNHKGSEKKALTMLVDLVATDVDAITFQILPPEFYQTTKEWGGNLSQEFYKKAVDFAHKNNKLIGFAIKDKEMIGFLNSAGADFYKTLSGSILDDVLLTQLQKTKKPLFVSTGLSDEKEIVSVSKKLPRATFLHTQLSHELEDSNVKAIERLRKITKKEIAFGLHATDHQVLYVAAAFNPKDVFFYVKDNVTEKFPDDRHAILITDVNEIVGMTKKLQKALGDGIKKNIENKIN